MNPTTNTCKNCGNSFQGKYCNQCGEKVYLEKDRKIIHLFEEVFHFLTHFEGSFFTTLKTMFTKPGQVSTDYCDGIRKKYFKPLSLFLLLVVLYLLFPLASGLNMPLKNHLENARYGAYATAKVNSYLTAHPDQRFKSIEQLFATKSEKLSKILLVFILPLCALVLWPISFFKRKFFFDQMVLSSEINSFFLLINFFILPLIIITIVLICRLFHGSSDWLTDDMYTFTGQIITAIYTAQAFKRFYHFGLLRRIIMATAFIYLHSFIVYTLYKFILFATVFYQIH